MNLQVENLEQEGRVKLTIIFLDTDIIKEDNKGFKIYKNTSILLAENTEFSGSQTAIFTYEDCIIASGTRYSYTVQYTDSENIPVSKTIEIQPFFEHAFLNGLNGKQLKIAYNPTISGYKLNVNDSITTTLGSPYPFITRQGAVRYKSFSIGGMIALQSDEANYLIDNNHFAYPVIYNENSEDNMYNIYLKEKEFREAALNFLTEPTPKLFRSLTEGNLIIRITGVSLSPENGIGRCIYSFSGQATEVAAATEDNYKKYGFINPIIGVMN